MAWIRKELSCKESRPVSLQSVSGQKINRWDAGEFSVSSVCFKQVTPIEHYLYFVQFLLSFGFITQESLKMQLVRNRSGALASSSSSAA